LSVRGLDCAFAFAQTCGGQAAPIQSLHLPETFRAWLGVASEGFADFEGIHSQRFSRGVQRSCS